MALGNLFEGWIEVLKIKLEESPVRKKIIEILSKKGELTISQVRDKLEDDGEKFNYRTIWQHIKVLEKEKFVETKQEIHKAGKPVIVRLLVNPNELEKMFSGRKTKHEKK